jgi:hypothetical protein
MQRRDFLAASALATTAAALPAVTQSVARAQAPAGGRHYIESRTYRVDSAEKQAILAKYLETAALPAWGRMGVGPVGVFKEIGDDATSALHVLLTYKSLAAFGEERAKLEADADYQKNAVEYFAASLEDPSFERIDSELLLGFEAHPQVTPPTKKPSVYELRTYESKSEERARAKIKMFNNGEMPIFVKCGFEAVFYGEALVGPNLPHLKYMLAAPDMDANARGWREFINHPDWAAMKDLPEYKDTVSKVTRVYLEALPFSQI